MFQQYILIEGVNNMLTAEDCIRRAYERLRWAECGVGLQPNPFATALQYLASASSWLDRAQIKINDDVVLNKGTNSPERVTHRD